MRQVSWTLLAAICLAACATQPTSQQLAATLEYGCDEVALVGRATTLARHEAASDHLLGQSDFKLRIAVKRVLFGHEDRPSVIATVMSHGEIRGDKDFLFILRRQSNGDFGVRSAAIWNAHPKPRLSKACS